MDLSQQGVDIFRQGGPGGAEAHDGFCFARLDHIEVHGLAELLAEAVVQPHELLVGHGAAGKGNAQ